MEKALILETTFLIDLERDHNKKRQGPALNVLKKYSDYNLYITEITAGELAAGKTLSDRSLWEQFITPFKVLKANIDVAWEYGKLYRFLQNKRSLIGSNDMWTASIALVYGFPVVTRNIEHYKRVPGLKVISY